jgi:hypothetical protein
MAMKHEFVESAAQALDRALARHMRAVADGCCSPVRLIVGAASSPLAHALWPHVAALGRAGGELKILLKSDRSGERAEMDRRLSQAGGAQVACIRMARFRGSDQLVEQLIFGDQLWGFGGVPPFSDSLCRLPSNDFSIRAAQASFEMVYALSDTFGVGRRAA